jgi:hypothetical protein
LIFFHSFLQTIGLMTVDLDSFENETVLLPLHHHTQEDIMLTLPLSLQFQIILLWSNTNIHLEVLHKMTRAEHVILGNKYIKTNLDFLQILFYNLSGSGYPTRAV